MRLRLALASHRAVALAALAGFACNATSSEAPGQSPAPRPSSPQVPSPHAELDRLDARSPVPLLPMMANHQKQSMREHLVAVQSITAAASKADFAAIAAASRSIGYSEQRGQRGSHMGAAAPGFRERAPAFHRSADRIGDAARRRDLPGVLDALSTTLAACTGCHASFKQQLVAELANPGAVGAPTPHPTEASH